MSSLDNCFAEHRSKLLTPKKIFSFTNWCSVVSYLLDT